MEHLTDQRLYAHVFDHSPLSCTEVDHLAGCATCQAELEDLVLLEQELEIGHRSQPSHTSLDSYRQLIRHVQRKQPVAWPVLVLEAIQMVLALDSRQQAPIMGMRQAGGRGYRLLFSADAADVEMLVEPQNHGRRLVGEILSLDLGRVALPALVELQARNRTAGTDSRIYEAESDEQGRFQLLDVALGQYDLVITPARGPLLTIAGTEIT